MKSKFLAAAVISLLLISLFGFLAGQIKPIFSTGTNITRVQGPASASVSAFTTVLTVNMASIPTTGNVLVAVISIWSWPSEANVTSINQTGVTWSFVVRHFSGGDSGGYFDTVEIWLGVVGSGAQRNMTISCGPHTYEIHANVCEYHGLSTSVYLDQTATNSGTSTSPDTGTTATTTQTSELWVGGLTDSYYGFLATPVIATNSFTPLDGSSGHATLYLEKIVTSAGTADSGSTSTQSKSWIGCIATFFAAPDITPPTYSNPATNTTVVGASCNFSVTLLDNSGLANCTFGTNNTGSWSNDTLVNIGSGLSYTANATKILNSTLGTICWEYWFADTSNNLNNTGIRSLATTNVYVAMYAPTNRTYVQGSILVNLTAFGSNIDKTWFNCKNASSWIYASNQTYTTPTTMTGIITGTSYTFYAWANNTGGVISPATTVMFSTVATSNIAITLIDAGDTNQAPFSNTRGATNYIYKNGTWQTENFMYIRCNVTGQGIDQVLLEWTNSSGSFNLTMTSEGNTVYDMNMTNQPTWYGYTFKIFVNDTMNNWVTYTWMYFDYFYDIITHTYGSTKWIDVPANDYIKHVGLAGINLHNWTYDVYYMDSMHEYNVACGGTYESDSHFEPHEQPTDDGGHDTGLMYHSYPTALAQVYCLTWVGWYLDNTTITNSATISNVYYHVWWRTDDGQVSIGPSATLGDSEDYNIAPGWATTVSSSGKQNITSDGTWYASTYSMAAGYMSGTPISLDGNTLNQLNFVFHEDAERPAVISTSLYPSWIVLNLPSNATLQSMDSNGNGISDYAELYTYFTDPFVTTSTNPQNITYASNTIPVQFSALGNEWYNCKNGTSWIYGSNQTYTSPTTMTGFVNGTYTFYAWVNYSGTVSQSTVMFSVAIPSITNPSLTLSSGMGGTTSPGPTVYTNYTSGSTVTIYETPTSGYAWSNWLVNGTPGGSNNPLSFVITGNTTVQPVFSATSVFVSITNPTNTTYPTSSVSVNFGASGGTIDKTWFNCKNGTSWIYANQTYTTPTTMTGIITGTSYTFYAWANNTMGLVGQATVMFSVTIPSIPDRYQYTFNFTDIAGNGLSSSVTWELDNGTTPLTYTQGVSSLLGGTYSLKTSYRGTLVNTTSLATATFGNSTIPISLYLKPETYGYLAFNSTVTGLTVNSQTSTNITFTVAGSSGPYQITLAVPKNATSVTKNGVPFTVWTYDGAHGTITITTATLSVWELDFAPIYIPPPPSTFVLTVVVTNQTVPVLGVSVSINGGSPVATGVSGIVTFSLSSGTYLVSITYQSIAQNQTVTLNSNQQITFDLSSPPPPPINWVEYELAIAVAVILVAVVSIVIVVRRRK